MCQDVLWIVIVDVVVGAHLCVRPKYVLGIVYGLVNT